MPTACRHVLDFGWRLTAPAIAEGRDAVYWQDGDGRVVGLAAWQQAWATLDFYVRPGARRPGPPTSAEPPGSAGR
jgi:hypothetical protein